MHCNSCHSPSRRLQALDRWENRLEALFEGRPYDALDAALTDTISRFPVHIQPFRHAVAVPDCLLATLHARLLVCITSPPSTAA